jgi:hypothetical protein
MLLIFNLTFLLLCSFCLYYLSYFIYFFLLPLSFNLFYKNNNLYLEAYYSNYVFSSNKLNTLNFLNTFEINLPFYSTDFFYIKILICCILCLLFPLLILLIKQMKNKTQFHFEKYRTHLSSQILFFCIITLFLYICIIPLILVWFFTHYTTFLLFEFDIQFNIQYFLTLYLKLFILNILLILSFSFIHMIPYYILFILINLIINITDYILLIVLFIFYYFIVKIIKYIQYINKLKLIYFYQIICHWKCNH